MFSSLYLQLIIVVLPIIISRFKSTLSCFKHHKKFLPKDVDLRSTLRTQRVVLLEVMETLSSDASDALKNQIGSSENLCLKLGLAIRTKLVEVEETTMRLPVATKAREQHVNAADILKASHLR